MFTYSTNSNERQLKSNFQSILNQSSRAGKRTVSELVNLWSKNLFPGKQILKWRLMGRTSIRDCY